MPSRFNPTIGIRRTEVLRTGGGQEEEVPSIEFCFYFGWSGFVLVVSEKVILVVLGKVVLVIFKKIILIVFYNVAKIVLP